MAIASATTSTKLPGCTAAASVTTVNSGTSNIEAVDGDGLQLICCR